MKYIKATNAPTPITRESGIVAYLYGVILIIMALSQLFSFDDFLTHFGNFGFPWFSQVVPVVIVVLEVFAVPFLLRIQLSPLMRVVSMVSGWLVAIGWLKISLWLVLTNNNVSNIGMLGTKVSLIPGWWAVFVSLALLLMSIWASWGMWPLKNIKTKL